MMLHGNTIDIMVEGGPAFRCKQLDHGDFILRVDGEEVTLESCPQALIGCDIPGSVVTVTVRKGSGPNQVCRILPLSRAGSVGAC
jgi:C-terminal processing protease CtpA/Prc